MAKRVDWVFCTTRAIYRYNWSEDAKGNVNSRLLVSCGVVSSGLAEDLDDAAHLVGDADLLRALGQAGFAIDTLVGSGIGGQCLTIAVKESMLALGIVWLGGGRQGQDMLIDSLVIETEVAGDVHTIGAWHAVSTRGAGDDGNARHAVGNLLEQGVLGIGARVER